MPRATGLVSAVPMLRNDAFEPHLASLLEQTRTDRAGVMVIVNYATARALQQLAEPQLADLQRLIAHINAVVGERSKAYSRTSSLHLPLCKPSKSEIPSGPSTTASPSITNDCLRSLSAASVISGYRSDQS